MNFEYERVFVERWSIDRLIPYTRNARTHSNAQVAQIAASIAEFGFNNPVLVDADGGIIAGHGRVLAAQAECCRGAGDYIAPSQPKPEACLRIGGQQDRPERRLGRRDAAAGIASAGRPGSGAGTDR